jgi:hypothetical protein
MWFGDFFWRVVSGGKSGEFAGFFEGGWRKKGVQNVVF